MTFSELYSRFNWRPIRNCPGRFSLAAGNAIKFNDFYLSLEEKIESISPEACDPVLVYFFEDGGIISYRHNDGFLVHTLNNLSGFERKLKDLELDDLL